MCRRHYRNPFGLFFWPISREEHGHKHFREYRVGDQWKDGISEKRRIKRDRRIKKQIQLFLEPSKAETSARFYFGRFFNQSAFCSPFRDQLV